jgi:hypothetical protein
MPVESAADRAAFFNVAEFGKAATYTPPGGGAGIACVVLLDGHDHHAEPGQAQPIAGQVTITVRADQVAAPAKGGTFLIGATTYRVLDRPRSVDVDRTIWAMWAISP